MAIIQSKFSKYSKPTTNGYWEDVRPWTCRCDFCGQDAYKSGETPGDAADSARKDGFITVCVYVSEPMKWACAVCKQAMDKEKI